VGPSGTEQGTGGHCLERPLFTLVWERWRFPKPAKPISLRVQGAKNSLETTRRRASRGERHQEHLESTRRRAKTSSHWSQREPTLKPPSHPPAGISKTKISLLIYGAVTSYKIGGTSTQSTELAARISFRSNQQNQFVTRFYIL